MRRKEIGRQWGEVWMNGEKGNEKATEGRYGGMGRKEIGRQWGELWRNGEKGNRKET